jgi:hypothetical protein
MEISAGHSLSNTEFPKRILVDTNFVIAVLTRKGVSKDDLSRIDHFLKRVEKAKSKIIIPMPVVAEFLVRADVAGVEILKQFSKNSYIQLAPFDLAAAYDCALLDSAAIGRGDKKDGATDSWQKIKIDRQIVAIGKANGANLLISVDQGIRNNASRVNIEAKSIDQLEFPDLARQQELPLKKPRK